MDSFQDYNQTLEPQSRLSSLFLILIFTLLASGTALVVLRQIDSYHRDQIYLATESTLPHHKISAATTTKYSSTIIPDAEQTSWKTYVNEEYGFEFKYPSSILVGEKTQSINLGDFQNPVYGISVSGSVLVVLSSESLQKEARKIIDTFAERVGKEPEQASPFDIPPVECQSREITNMKAQVEAVYCTGDGGPAYYAYIKSDSVDLFFDGYPARTLDPQTSDLILATIKFTK